MSPSCFRRASYVLCSVIILGIHPASAQRPEIEWNAPPKKWHWVIPEVIPGMRHVTLRSESMKRSVGYNIYLPPSYDSASARRHPVVYYLHGASGSELSAYELGDVVQELTNEGKLGDAIYVFPNGGHFSLYRDWDDANVKSETFIIRELIPHIDATYRTIAARDGRALCGWSMGGDAALRFAFKYPEMFCAAGSMSAAIDYGEDDASTDTIFAHSTSNANRIRGRIGLMMVIGEDDDLYRTYPRLLPHLDQLRIEYAFRSYPGVGHDLGTISDKAAEDIVLMLAEHYTAAK